MNDQAVDAENDVNASFAPVKTEMRTSYRKAKLEDEKVDYGKRSVKSAKINDIGVNQMEMMKIALGTKNDSDIIRWCIAVTWGMYGDDIKHIIKEMKKIGIQLPEIPVD